MSDERPTDERNVVIGESTRIKLTIARVMLIVGIAFTIGGSWAVAVYALNAKIDAVEADDMRHLEKNFIREKGLPVGTWDLRALSDQTTNGLKGLQAQVDAIRSAEERHRQDHEDRKVRYRP